MTFSLRARHSGHTSWLQQGDAISLEFEDGKGVSGRIADVDVAPGGSAFTIICTHDGRIEPREEDDNYAARLADVVVQGKIVTSLSHPHTSPRDREELDGTQLPIPELVNLDTGLTSSEAREVESWKKAHTRLLEILETERAAHRTVTDELNAEISRLKGNRGMAKTSATPRVESILSRTTVQAGAVTITVEENR